MLRAGSAKAPSSTFVASKTDIKWSSLGLFRGKSRHQVFNRIVGVRHRDLMSIRKLDHGLHGYKVLAMWTNRANANAA